VSTPEQTTSTAPEADGAGHENGATPMTRRRKMAVWVLIVVSTIVLLVAALTVWVKREVLDTNNFTASTTELMRNPKVQSALATFLVDQIYQNVDVKADLQKQLPSNLKGLAGPAAAALNDYGTRAATRLLGTNAVIDLVQAATRLAHAQFLRIVDDKPGAGQKVYLQLRPVVLRLAGRLGLEEQVSARLPPDAGQFLVLDDANGTINTVRQSVRVVRALSLFLLLVVVALYAAAIWLARGWRREAILRCGAGVLIVGLLLFVIRHVLQGLLLVTGITLLVVYSATQVDRARGRKEALETFAQARSLRIVDVPPSVSPAPTSAPHKNLGHPDQTLWRRGLTPAR